MIQLLDVFKFYKTERHSKIILDHVSMVFDTSYWSGLLGVNGAGKTTTLKILAGTELPNSGKVRRTVRVSWPLGFGEIHPSMTGRENVHFVARVYGADPRKAAMFVEEFSELGDYFDAPVKTYSSGMGARLAFGMSMSIDFDVYLIDEITGVGDMRIPKAVPRGLQPAAQEFERDFRLAFDAGGQRLLRSRRRARRRPSVHVRHRRQGDRNVHRLNR